MLRAIEKLLRQESGEDPSHGSKPRLVRLCIILGMIYGFAMGLYSILRPDHRTFAQLVATTLKVPLLFLSTLVITLPSLHVFATLAGSRTDIGSTWRLLASVVAVTSTVLASLAPINAFFTFSTASYSFMVLLNVIIFGVAGIAGLNWLKRGLATTMRPPRAKGAKAHVVEQVASDGADPSSVGEANAQTSSSPEGPASETPTGTLHSASEQPMSVPPRDRYALFEAWHREDVSGRILRTWIVIYVVVGTQMGWVLRPFIGNPEEPFTLFRKRESNFLAAVLGVIRDLIS